MCLWGFDASGTAEAALQDLSVRVLTEAMKPEGFNIGMNLGKAAGAGIDHHLVSTSFHGRYGDPTS